MTSPAVFPCVQRISCGFLGAGASASAGLPTAIDMIWEFKQKLYVSQRRGSLPTVSDLSHPLVRARLQAHVDSLGLPPSGAPDEYADLFEAVYPAESDRQKFLDAKVAGAHAVLRSHGTCSPLCAPGWPA